MPPCAETKLFDLATRAFVINLPYHCRIYEKYSHVEEIRRRYKLIQFLITDKIIGHLEHLHQNEKIEDDELRKLTGFLFEGKGICVFPVEYMLRFLLNKHTKRSYPLLFRMCNGSYQLFFLLSRCVGLKELIISSAIFKEAWLTKSLSSWSQLRTVKIASVDSNDKIVTAILENCQELETLWVEGAAVTNESMFSLCGNRRKKCSSFFGSIEKVRSYVLNRIPGMYSFNIALNSGTYALCENSTTCCTFGKKLTQVSLNRTSITVEGIACFLEHCHAVTIIKEPIPSKESASGIPVPEAILLIRNSMTLDQKQNFKLNLKDVNFGFSTNSRTIQDVTECCPNLKCIRLNSWGNELMVSNEFPFPPVKINFHISPQNSSLDVPGILDFLVSKGHQVHQLVVQSTGIFSFRASSLETILRSCINLKFLLLKRCRVWDWNELLDVPHSVGNIEELALVDLEIQDPAQRYFTDILRRTESLKFLVVSGGIAEGSLMEAFEDNGFANLEVLVVHRADLRNVSLLPLINPAKKLKCVQYSRCKYVKEFVQTHKEAAQEKGVKIRFKRSFAW